MNLQKSLRYIWRYFHQCDWESDEYDEKKAFVGAVFSNLAYAHISDLELQNTRNVNLVPSEEYESRILNYLKTSTRTDVRELLREADIPEEGFVITGQTVVASIVIVRGIVFVSLRGTELLNIHDWKNNLNILKTSSDISKNSEAKFHRGFYKEVISFKNNLEEEILRRYGEDVKIYVTGHSLGGALAAVLYSLWKGNKNSGIKHIVSAYTFGMPRYANRTAVSHYPNPYHILNSKDIVPHLPPKHLGYANCANNISLDDSIIYKKKNSGYFVYIKGFGNILTARKLEHHSIETYVGRIHTEIETTKQ